jgi:hypothetical protein
MDEAGAAPGVGDKGRTDMIREGEVRRLVGIVAMQQRLQKPAGLYSSYTFGV